MYSFSVTNKIISEVKKRPSLYNKNHADYNNKDLREEMWTEICWDLFPNWSDLQQSERQTRLRDVQKKWRNVRDSFRKELKSQSKQIIGNTRKKRPYIYHKQMKFMIPFITVQETSQDIIPDKECDDEDDGNDESEVIKFKFEDDCTLLSTSSHDSRFEVEENDEVAEQPVFEIWENGFSKDVDEDRYFLLSLIPSFKKLSPQQKLQAKVEFLQVLQRIN